MPTRNIPARDASAHRAGRKPLSYHVLLQEAGRPAELQWTYSKLSPASRAALAFNKAPGRCVLVVDSTKRELMRIN